MMKATLMGAVAGLALGDLCCETCPEGKQKYYSVDTPHGHCGEACIRQSMFWIFKIFEPNLTIADGSTGYSSCAELGWPKYRETVTHGDPLKILTATLDLYDHDDAQDGTMSWESYKQNFGKVYNGEADATHQAQFEANSQLIQEHNAKGESLQLGYNQFTDMTQDEYRVAAGLGYKPSAQRHGALPNLGVHTYNGEELAASVDWTTQGAVTGVKDQGQCGSCWAFSTTGGIEGAWEIASGRLQSLSEQQIVSCSTNGNAGCQGGDMGLAFEWAETNNLATEDSYPYTATDGSCKTSGFTVAVPAGGVTGYKSVEQSTAGLKSALNLNPVSVAIEADQLAFQLYSGGILTNSGGLFGSCGTNLDHGVLAVGYGDGFFKVKNSWGASWGENGYLKISDQGNTCGIHSDATYPTVSASSASLTV